MRPTRPLRAVAPLASILGAPGLIIAGVSLASFVFGLVLMTQEYDRPRQLGREAVEALVHDWVCDTDVDGLGQTIRDYAADWSAARGGSREAAAFRALAAAATTLGEAADRPRDDALALVRVEALELHEPTGPPLHAWRSPESPPGHNARTDDVALVVRTDGGPAPVGLHVTYRVGRRVDRVLTDLENSYRRLLLAVAGLAGYSLLCLGYMVIQARGLSHRAARDAARQATLDLADRTCHELGNVVFVLANERRNLADYLDLVDRHLDESTETLALAAARAGLDSAKAAELARLLRREHARRGLDPQTDLRDGAAMAREVSRQIEVCAEYLGLTVRELDGYLKEAVRPLRLESIAVDACIDDAFTLLRPRLEAAGAVLQRPGSDGSTLRVLADRRLVVHALVNLIKNALEAAASVGQAPRISVEASPRGERLVEIVVTDDGPGIPPEVLPRIFESNYSTKGPGRGRGLAITKESIEAQGGGLMVESRRGDRTRFVIALPAARSS